MKKLLVLLFTGVLFISIIVPANAVSDIDDLEMQISMLEQKIEALQKEIEKLIVSEGLEEKTNPLNVYSNNGSFFLLAIQG